MQIDLIMARGVTFAIDGQFPDHKNWCVGDEDGDTDDEGHQGYLFSEDGNKPLRIAGLEVTGVYADTPLTEFDGTEPKKLFVKTTQGIIEARITLSQAGDPNGDVDDFPIAQIGNREIPIDECMWHIRAEA